MAEQQEKILSSTGVMEEKIELYALAVCGLYDRMLRYAGVVHNTDRSSYMDMRELVNHVYATNRFGFNLKLRLTDGSKRENILQLLEKEYKETCGVYKSALVRAQNIYFENELNANFVGNTLPDRLDRLRFDALRKAAGKRVHAYLISRAADGDPKAMLQVGKNFFLGWGTHVDVDAGLYWLDKAAKTGNPEALLYLGLAHETIQDLTTDYRLNPESIRCYEAAYAKGSKDAAYALYRFFRHHLSDRVSRTSSKKWLRRGKEEGNAPCLYTEEDRIPEGNWVPGNVRNAVQWIKHAALYGEADAYDLLADLYEGGRAGLPKDLKRSEECRKRALDLA